MLDGRTPGLGFPFPSGETTIRYEAVAFSHHLWYHCFQYDTKSYRIE